VADRAIHASSRSAARALNPTPDQQIGNGKRKKTDLKNKIKSTAWVFSLVAGHGESHHGQGREERRKPFQSPPRLAFMRRRVNPRAAIWRWRVEQRAANGLQFHMTSSAVLGFLGVCFVIFTCWNMYLNYCLFFSLNFCYFVICKNNV
jgi:hypothetical protein